MEVPLLSSTLPSSSTKSSSVPLISSSASPQPLRIHCLSSPSLSRNMPPFSLSVGSDNGEPSFSSTATSSTLNPPTTVSESHRPRVTLNNQFLKRLYHLLRIAIPSWTSPESLLVCCLLCSLSIRTFLSLWIAAINGRIVKSIVRKDLKGFVRRLLVLMLYSFPASFINSSIGFFSRLLALRMRGRLTAFYLRLYLHRMTFYKIATQDKRISHPDQRLTEDIQKWAHAFTSLFTNVTKPLLDIAILSQKLSEYVGARGPLSILAWYCLSAGILKSVSPPFGQLAAEEQEAEGDYRSAHCSVVQHAEEVAFLRGQLFEATRLCASYGRIFTKVRRNLWKKLWMECCDGLLVKYGAVLVGYTILALPVFGPRRQRYLGRIREEGGSEGEDWSFGGIRQRETDGGIGNLMGLAKGEWKTRELLRRDVDSEGGNVAAELTDIGGERSSMASITQDYVRNSSLLINLAKAVGRVVVSYKEVQVLAGYTQLLWEMLDVLRDLAKGREVVGLEECEELDVRKEKLADENGINQDKVDEALMAIVKSSSERRDDEEEDGGGGLAAQLSVDGAEDAAAEGAAVGGRRTAKEASEDQLESIGYGESGDYLLERSSSSGSLIMSLPKFASEKKKQTLDEVKEDDISEVEKTKIKGISYNDDVRTERQVHYCNDRIEFLDVTICTPKGELLIDNISFVVKEGYDLFILGPNGSGKSSLFRVLGELWKMESGKVYKPSAMEMFYIPQKPYLPRGTLRQQLTYPDFGARRKQCVKTTPVQSEGDSTQGKDVERREVGDSGEKDTQKRETTIVDELSRESSMVGMSRVSSFGSICLGSRGEESALGCDTTLLQPSSQAKGAHDREASEEGEDITASGNSGIGDEELYELLKGVSLEYLLYRHKGGWDECRDWNDELSGGEKQRIAIARLWYHRPKFAILDEATSAVSVDIEGKLYASCKDRGITLITISHRLNLLKYHNRVLQLDGKGGWRFGVLADNVVDNLSNARSYSELFGHSSSREGLGGGLVVKGGWIGGGTGRERELKRRQGTGRDANSVVERGKIEGAKLRMHIVEPADIGGLSEIRKVGECCETKDSVEANGGLRANWLSGGGRLLTTIRRTLYTTLWGEGGRRALDESGPEQKDLSKDINVARKPLQEVFTSVEQQVPYKASNRLCAKPSIPVLKSNVPQTIIQRSIADVDSDTYLPSPLPRVRNRASFHDLIPPSVPPPTTSQPRKSGDGLSPSSVESARASTSYYREMNKLNRESIGVVYFPTGKSTSFRAVTEAFHNRHKVSVRGVNPDGYQRGRRDSWPRGELEEPGLDREGQGVRRRGSEHSGVMDGAGTGATGDAMTGSVGGTQRVMGEVIATEGRNHMMNNQLRENKTEDDHAQQL
eukprot:GHVQ01033178.1.p1 GENE.GHVQ01033178.1~~GHVQ01033178.1.p1  ORF type:complete len:1377 (-),score=264.45 GHVQ01033178.1:1056-5186(-)